MTERQYIWITGWERFQHYTPRRDRGPAWIKDYGAQLDDERYLELTDRQRALLQDLRRIFAVMRAQLPRDTRLISRRRGRQTFRTDLEALNQAGFLTFCSRTTLDQALDQLYASRASQEVELELELEQKPSQSQNPRPPTHETPPADELAELVARTAAGLAGISLEEHNLGPVDDNGGVPW
jgi:hypothetical protein